MRQYVLDCALAYAIDITAIRSSELAATRLPLSAKLAQVMIRMQVAPPPPIIRRHAAKKRVRHAGRGVFPTALELCNSAGIGPDHGVQGRSARSGAVIHPHRS